MIVFGDGFDYYPQENTSRKWSDSSGLLFEAGVYGGYAARIRNWYQYLQKYVTPQAAYGVSFYFNIAVSSSSTGDFLRFQESGNIHVGISLNSLRQIVVNRNGTVLGTSTNSFTAGVWYHVEVKVYVHDSAGLIEIRVGGTSVDWINLSSIDTRNGQTGVINTILFRTITNTGGGWEYLLDHVVMWDMFGSRNNNFLGDKKITLQKAIGDGDLKQWTASTPDNYTNVDEASTDDDTTFNYASDPDFSDLYTFGGTHSGVLAVLGNLVARKTDADAAALTHLCKSGGSVYEGPSFEPGESYLNDQDVMEVDPATSAVWASNGVANAQFGVKRSS